MAEKSKSLRKKHDLEHELCRLYYEEGDAVAFKKLLDRYKYLFDWASKKWKNWASSKDITDYYEDEEDLEQDLCVYFIEAINLKMTTQQNFDFDFIIYSNFRARFRAFQNKKSNRISRSPEIRQNIMNNSLIKKDFTKSLFEEEEVCKNLYNLFKSKLSKNEKILLENLENKTKLKDIAPEMNMSENSISYYKKQLKTKYIHHMREYGYFK